ncbi:HEAT repeat domain-containing protein [Halosimplex aquaticum]
MTDEYANWSARGRAPADDEAGLRAALDGDQPRKREAALALVDEAESGLADATAERLVGAARSADDAKTRQFAVEALGVAGRERETIAAALDDPDEWVRAEAVVALSRAAPGASGQLREALADDHPAVRRNALIALAKTDAAGADLLVDRLKNDPRPAVREYAAQFLPEEAETERAVRLLAAVLARDPGSFVRAKAADGSATLAPTAPRRPWRHTGSTTGATTCAGRPSGRSPARAGSTRRTSTSRGSAAVRRGRRGARSSRRTRERPAATAGRGRRAAGSSRRRAGSAPARCRGGRRRDRSCRVASRPRSATAGTQDAEIEQSG